MEVNIFYTKKQTETLVTVNIKYWDIYVWFDYQAQLKMFRDSRFLGCFYTTFTLLFSWLYKVEGNYPDGNRAEVKRQKKKQQHYFSPW